MRYRLLAVAITIVAVVCEASGQDVRLRIASFNIEDVRTEALVHGDDDRLMRAAEVLQRIRPNIVLINEIAYDMPGGPGVPTGAHAGENGVRFVESYVSVSQGAGLKPLRYRVFMAPSNTGVPSGFDLNRDGEVAAPVDEIEGRGSAEARASGQDCWGYGLFPGQYGMALLVDERLEIALEEVRTFQHLAWSSMPDAAAPMRADGLAWYAPEVWSRFPLSSKSHWDVPVRLPSGRVVHVLCAHPTPPAFDGPEGRNQRRNHDEIRFWAEYLDDAEWIVDDQGRSGGLESGREFVIVGDLNADPVSGTGYGDPMGLLLGHRRLGPDPEPRAAGESGPESLHTARWGKRVDYVLPSAGLRVERSGVWRGKGVVEAVSDHFPVWADVLIPGR